MSSNILYTTISPRPRIYTRAGNIYSKPHPLCLSHSYYEYTSFSHLPLPWYPCTSTRPRASLSTLTLALTIRSQTVYPYNTPARPIPIEPLSLTRSLRPIRLLTVIGMPGASRWLSPKNGSAKGTTVCWRAPEDCRWSCRHHYSPHFTASRARCTRIPTWLLLRLVARPQTPA